MGASSVEAKWIGLFDELCRTPGIQDRIAGPFFSVRGAEERTILYVGKATAKEWYRDNRLAGLPDPSDVGARVEERLDRTRKFIHEDVPTYNSGFWQFARNLNKEASTKWRVPLSDKNPVQHITWTNICKIGAVKGNPSGFLLERQRELAIETLRHEIKLYKPQLICFATWDYSWSLVKQVLGDSTDDEWDQTGNKEWMWCRPPMNGWPAVLLTGHPERKSAELHGKWVRRVLEILPE